MPATACRPPSASGRGDPSWNRCCPRAIGVRRFADYPGGSTTSPRLASCAADPAAPPATGAADRLPEPAGSSNRAAETLAPPPTDCRAGEHPHDWVVATRGRLPRCVANFADTDPAHHGPAFPAAPPPDPDP